jgi:hypothetical protein
VKLESNASDTCAMLSEDYGGEAVKRSNVLSGISKSQNRTMLITFFDIKGNVPFEFIPESQIVNQASYIDILRRVI